MKPVVSVITSNYNQGQFLTASVESVLRQTFDRWELIIIDDGSTDDSWTVISKLATRDPRIRAIRQEHKGMAHIGATYNSALELCEGTLIAILDADDLWLADRLEIQVPLHVQGTWPISFSQCTSIDGHGVHLPGNPYPSSGLLGKLSPRDRYLSLLRGEYFIPTMTALISRETLESVGGFQQPEYIPAYDYPTWLALGRECGFGFLPRVTGYRRLHGSGQATWVMARSLARGALQCAMEAAREEELGISSHELKSYLMSPNRQGFLADASYRSGALVAEAGDFRTALSYGLEILALGRITMAAKYAAMLAVKLGRRSSRVLRGTVAPVDQQLNGGE